MAERRLAVAPFIAHAYRLRPVHERDLLAQLVVRRGDGQLLDLLLALRLVDGHVEDAKVQLAEVEQRLVDVFRADEVRDDFVGDLFGRRGRDVLAGLFAPSCHVVRREGGVVLAQGFELRGGPAPVLQHLTGCFHKVAHGVGAVEARPDRLGDQVVDAVAQLVEERHHLVVLEQTGFLGGGLGEVAHQCRRGVSTVTVGIDEAL